MRMGLFHVLRKHFNFFALCWRWTRQKLVLFWTILIEFEWLIIALTVSELTLEIQDLLCRELHIFPSLANSCRLFVLAGFLLIYRNLELAWPQLSRFQYYRHPCEGKKLGWVSSSSKSCSERGSERVLREEVGSYFALQEVVEILKVWVNSWVIGTESL